MIRAYLASSSSSPASANGSSNGNANANADAEPTVLERIKKLGQTVVDWAVLIIMLVLPGTIDNYAIAFGVAFGVGVVLMIYNFYLHHHGLMKVFPKVFETGVVIINLALLIFEVSGNPSYEWSKKWTGVISSACLLALALLSILIGKPFTIEFAKEKVPEALWSTPVFYTVNLHISAVWALEFALSIMFSILSIYVYPDNDAARIAPGIVILVLALKFTTEYPKYLRERAMKARVSQEGPSLEAVESNAPFHNSEKYSG